MPIEIRIPTPLRRHTGERAQVGVATASEVSGALAAL
ncbi:MAG: molybdopterin synthase sulfur carrier subunit, partial [Acidobacteria bacterium]|nr:molybdopterin synthase sulfur carrier subunit [Acidobacteriota bacterium]